MKNIKLLIVAIVMIASYGLSAQMAVTTDGSSADASAMLEVKSTDKGFLPPRMTATEIGNIVSPANGLFVFNTTDNKAYIFVSADNEWKELNYGTGTIAAPFCCGDNFIDERNSQSYTTVEIGTQCWMAENLNVGIKIASVGSQTNNSTIEKYCFNDDATYCGTYGGLYQWAEMVQYENGSTNATSWDPVPSGNVQGICPDGWHLPTDSEWTTVIDFLGGESVAGDEMKEEGTTHWLETTTDVSNSSGFTALPGGVHFTDGFISPGYYGLFCPSSEGSATNVWYRQLGFNYAQVYRYDGLKATAYSVRCIKD